MNETNKPPRFFSLEFHTSFFPALLGRVLHPEKRKHESIFAGHIALEYPVLAAISIITGVYGMIEIIDSGSITGWVCAILGSGGFIYFLCNSIHSGVQIRPSFENFRAIIFFFFMILGMTIGLEIGIVCKISDGFRIIPALAGLFLGYFSGIGGGLWVQKLGWMASLLDIIGVMAIAGMVIFDIFLLTATR